MLGLRRRVFDELRHAVLDLLYLFVAERLIRDFAFLLAGHVQVTCRSCWCESEM